MARFDGLAGVAAHANAATVSDDLLLVATGADGPGPDAVWVRRRAGSGWSGWSPIGQPTGGAMACRPAVARDANGAHVIVVPGQDGAVWSTREDPASGTGWSAWETLGQPGDLPVISGHLGARPADPAPLLIADADGRLKVFVVVSDQSVWHTVQLQPEAPWLPWVPLGLPGGDNDGTVGPLAGAINVDGGLDLFTIDTGNTVRLRQQLMPSQDFSDWESLGSPDPGLDGTRLGVTRISDGRLELFMAASDGAVWHRWQNKGGPGWAAWAPLGQPSPGGHHHQLADLAVAQDRASGLVLYATETVTAAAPAGSPWLWLRTQWAEGAPWVKWNQLRLTTGSTTRQVDGPMLTAYGNQLVLVLRETGTANIFVVTQGAGDPSDLTGWHVDYLTF